MAVKLWTPSPIWTDEPCYIIGGGPSLQGFGWEALRGRHVIGCNVACYLDPGICPWVVFGDASFLSQHRSALDRFVAAGGRVVTNSNKFRKPRLGPPWLKLMKKVRQGLALDGLGWNGNTGASAVNLGLLMGANPVYLLGFDMQMRGKQANYHNAYNLRPNPKAYPRFLKGMGFVYRDLPKLFPGQRIINLEDNTSALVLFPKESLREHFQPALVGDNHG